MSSSATLTVSQYINAVSLQTMALASGWSSAAQRFALAVAAEGGAAVVTAERQFQLLAQNMAAEFHQLATQSQMWAAAAESQSQRGYKEIMNRYSAKYAAQANALLDPVLSAEARVAALAAEARTGVLAAEKSFGGTFGRAVGPAFDAFQLTQGALNWGSTGDSTAFGQAAVGVALSWGAGIVFGAGAFALGAGALGAALAAGIAAGIGAALGNAVFDLINDASRSHPESWDWFYGKTALGKGLGRVFVEVADFFGLSQRIVPRRDPLTLDLDGDGLETVGVAAGVLFDHDGDGVRSGTGWVSGDDGLLVLDRNGNGQIDNGRELFGDSTPLAGGGTALDGFAALAQEDTNADGRVDSLDANWSNLRVWRDLNQDGVSQSGELFTLGSLGITARTAAGNRILPVAAAAVQG